MIDQTSQFYPMFEYAICKLHKINKTYDHWENPLQMNKNSEHFVSQQSIIIDETYSIV